MKNIPIIQGSGGGGKGGSGGSGATQSATTLQSKALLNIVEVISEGEIQGLVNGAQSIFFDQTPLQNLDGTYNFTGIAWDSRPGLPDQAYFPGISDVEQEVSIGVKVFQAGPLVRTIDDTDTDAVRVTLQVPALTYQDPDTGNISGQSVDFAIDYKASNTGWINVVTDFIAGLTTAPYQKAWQWNLTGLPPWDIRVTRISQDNINSNINQDLYWSAYTRIINSKMIYPDSALIALGIDSSLFGSSVPTRSYLIRGIILQVPSNYDPVARTYTGIWDGTFKRAYSNNPAWVLYDLLTNARYGLGQYVDATEVDKFGLYTIAQYCDGLVPDGKGGMEPRFTFNYAITSQDTALKVLQYVASTFRGMMYWGSAGISGIITSVIDMPKDPIKLITNANVISGLFTYTGTALETRHSAVWVTWNNPDLSYRTDIMVYEDPALIQLYGYRKLDTVAYGCTSPGQAKRFGKWVLETEQYESEALSFGVGIADADLRPGDIVSVADANYASIRMGGRIVTATSTTVTLDDTFAIDGVQAYSISLTMPDGTIAIRNITNGVGTYSTLNLDVALTQIPGLYGMFVITSSEVNPRPFRVIGVKEKTPSEFEVTCMFYDVTKFARVEQNINVAPISFSNLPVGRILPPSGITILPYISRSGLIDIGSIIVSWQASTDPRVVNYGLEVITPGQDNNYELVSLQQGITYTLVNTSDGDWSFRVRAFDGLNNASAYTLLENQLITISSTPPADVINFTIASLGENSILSWDPVISKNLDHYEVRYNASTSGAAWENSQVITDQAANSSTSCTVPSQVGTYLIKAVSVPTTNYPSGLYSNNADLIVTNVDILTNYTLQAIVQQDPLFAGVKTNTQRTATPALELTLANPTTVNSFGEYVFDNFIDLGSVYTVKASMLIDASGDNITDIVDNWTNVDLITNVDGATDGQWQIIPYISITQNGTSDILLLEDGSYMAFEDGDYVMTEDSTAVWSDYQALSTGSLVAQRVQAKVRLISLFPTVTPSLDALTLRVDMPNYTQSQNDLVLGPTSPDLTGSGQNVAFPVQFGSPSPALGIAAQNMQTGDYYTITNKTATGFNILFFNSSGVGQTRTLDYSAKGYGYVSS